MLRLTNPFNQELIQELPYQSDDEVRGKLDAAAGAFATWRHVPVDERVVQVRAGLQRLRAEADAMAREVSAQMGKPIREARGEVSTMLDRAAHMIDIAAESLAPDVLPDKAGFVRRIEHAPVGVVFNIAAWNYPLLIPVNVVVPALLAGNAVLLKHSAKTPLCGARFERAFANTGGGGLVHNLVISHDQAAKLIGDPRIAYVAFTGSVRGGAEIYRATAATRFIDVGLELGGKDPAYIAADADLDFTVANIVEGACYNAGQSCCAIERAYVHADVYDEFIERAAPLIAEYRLGDPLDDATTMGPQASGSAPAFLGKQVADAVERGARVVQGDPDGVDGNFFPPVLIADVPNDAEAMQEESFGPLLPIARVESDDEALHRMNDSRFGLTASVWTQDQERAEHMASRLDAGTIFQNRCDFLDPALPWTGVGESGKGSTLSRYGFFHLTRRKSIHFRIKP